MRRLILSNKCAFTICTASYIGLARTLKYSFLRYHPDYVFYIIIADEPQDNLFSDDGVLYAKKVMNVDDNVYYQMAFKYTVTEFCTSIKPFGFDYFFSLSFETAIYLDPDLCFYSAISGLDEPKSLFLVPHILYSDFNERGIWTERVFLKYGVYNCGFVALKKTEHSRIILSWWKQKLKDEAFADPVLGLFTDQKWMDMIVSFLPTNELGLLRDIGLDVAPWNLHEREIFQSTDHEWICRKRNDFSVIGRLVFFHFSGFKYKDLEAGKVVFDHDMEISDKLKVLAVAYGQELLKHNVGSFLNIPYSYSIFENKVVIEPFYRRLYAQAINENKTRSILQMSPFLVGEGSYYSYLKKNHLLFKSVAKKERADLRINHGSQGSNNRRVYSSFVRRCVKLLGIRLYLRIIIKLNYLTDLNTQYQNFLR